MSAPLAAIVAFLSAPLAAIVAFLSAPAVLLVAFLAAAPAVSLPKEWFKKTVVVILKEYWEETKKEGGQLS